VVRNDGALIPDMTTAASVTASNTVVNDGSLSPLEGATTSSIGG
jgi:hypothetical protein